MRIVEKQISRRKQSETTYGYTLNENDYAVSIELTIFENRAIGFCLPLLQMETPSYFGLNLFVAKELNIDWNKVVTIHSTNSEYLKDEDKKKIVYALKAACSDFKHHI